MCTSLQSSASAKPSQVSMNTDSSARLVTMHQWADECIRACWRMSSGSTCPPLPLWPGAEPDRPPEELKEALLPPSRPFLLAALLGRCCEACLPLDWEGALAGGGEALREGEGRGRRSDSNWSRLRACSAWWSTYAWVELLVGECTPLCWLGARHEEARRSKSLGTGEGLRRRGDLEVAGDWGRGLAAPPAQVGDWWLRSAILGRARSESVALPLGLDASS